MATHSSSQGLVRLSLMMGECRIREAHFQVIASIGAIRSVIMTKRIKETPREHFVRTADEQFAKFEREERALRRAERDERAARLRFPLGRENLSPAKNDER